MNRLHKLVVHLLVIGLLVIGLGLAKPSTREIKPDSIALLNESYDLVDQMDDSKKAIFLFFLTQTGAEVGAPREEDWCLQMFRQSFKVENPWDRISLEKDSLVALAAVNSSEAMKLFWQIEDPQPDARGEYPEDVRAFGFKTVAPKYWADQMKGQGTDESRLHEAIRVIRQLAAHIGSNGEYPYAGVATIMKQLKAVNQDTEINRLFEEALNSYSEGKPKFRNRDTEFLKLLEAASTTVSDPTLLRTAADRLVKNLKTPTLSSNLSFEGEYRTANGETVKFNDRNKSLLFKAFPTIKAVDPELAQSLIADDEVLEKATANMKYLSGGVVEGNTTPQQAEALHRRMRQISLLSQIQKLQKTDPVGAKQLAEKFSDTNLRLVALSSTLPGLMQVDPSTAKAIYANERTQVQDLTDDNEKSQGLVALAKAAFYVQDSNFYATASRAFEHGVELYGRDDQQRPDLRADLHKGYDDLGEIVRFTAARNLDWILPSIRSVQNVELKAHLLVYAAEGASEAKRDQ